MSSSCFSDKRILVVEDDASMLSVILLLLRTSGFQVEGLRSASAAIRRFAPGMWDLVITDFVMTDGNGEAFAAEIKRTDPKIMVMLVTGMPTLVKAPHLFDAILMKPFGGSEMLACLQTLFSAQ